MTDALAKRYGGLVPNGSLPRNAVTDLMLAHRSVRNFDTRPLPEGMLETLIAAGQSAATSSNMQAVSVVAVSDPARRATLSKLAGGQAFLATAATVLCVVLDRSRARRVEAAIGVDLFALDMLDPFISGVSDCAIFAQNVALAAESFGIGTCYVGNLRSDPETLAQLLDLPPECVVVFGLCLGYEKDRVTDVRPRLPQSIVLYHETYDATNEPAELAKYDAVFSAHEVAQGRSAGKWSERHKDRFASAAYLAGREKMRDILLRLGFKLK